MVCHCWYASSCYHTAREKTFSPVRSSLISLQGYLMEFSYHGEINVPGKGVGSSCTPALVLPFMEATWSLWVQALGSTDLGISILHMSRLAHWLVHTLGFGDRAPATGIFYTWLSLMDVFLLESKYLDINNLQSMGKMQEAGIWRTWTQCHAPLVKALKQMFKD